MIRPQPKPGLGRVQAVATVLTALLLLGVQLGLSEIPLPAFASSRDQIRELDPLMLERFVLPPRPPEAAPEESRPEEAPEEEPSRSFEQEVGLAMEELQRRFADREATVPDVERAAEGPGPGVTPGITADPASERFESLFGAGGDVAVGRAARARPAADPSRPGLGLGITERSTPSAERTGVSDSGVAGPTVAVAAGGERARIDTAEVTIGEFEGENFDRSEAQRLADWMRAHRVPLPIGVRVHVNFQPSFLTSAASVSSSGRQWELYLMLNEALQELHIVLIEGDRSVYLIDRGFQEQSRSLREGTVRRSGGEIVAVDSRSAAASSERTSEFYDVFLSWWEATKNDAPAR